MKTTFFMLWISLFNLLLPMIAFGQTDTIYYNNKKIQKVTIKNKEVKTVWEYFHSGAKKAKYFLLRDTLNGLYTSWNEKGIKRYEINYELNLMVGDMKEYLSSGLLLHHYHYKIILENGTRQSVQDGVQKEYANNGLLRSEIAFKNGKQHGLEVQYYEQSGIKRLEHYFINGYTIGNSKEWYANGQIMFKGQKDTIMVKYPNRKKPEISTVNSGFCETWYENGVKQSAGKFVKGQAIGEHKKWFATGKLEQVQTLPTVKKYGYLESYFSNGQLKNKYHYFLKYDPIQRYNKTFFDGKYETYDENGKPEQLGNYKDGKQVGKFYRYYEGQLSEEFNYKNGHLFGEQFSYYNNGKPLLIETYEPFVVEGRDTTLKHGIAKQFYEDGTLRQTINYKKGIMHGSNIIYFPNGKIERELFMTGKDQYQVVKEYNKDGSISKNYGVYVNAKNPKQEPIYYLSDLYDEKGNLRNHFTYYNGLPQGNMIDKNDQGKLIGEAYLFAPTKLDYLYPGSIENAWNVTYYPTGELCKEFYGTRGFDLNIEWYINGNLKRIQQYNELDIQWLSNGELMDASVYKNYGNLKVDTILDKAWINNLYVQFNANYKRTIQLAENPNQGYAASYYHAKQIKFETYINNGKFDSIFRGYYLDGSLMVEWHLKNGLPHGTYTLMNPNQTINTKHEYVNGFSTGVWVQNDNFGAPQNEYGIDSILPNGDVYSWEKDYQYGKLQSFVHKQNKEPYGIQTYYFQNGNISSQFYMNKGKQVGVSLNYFENGIMNQRTYYDSLGKQTGVFERYHQNGKLNEKYEFERGKKTGAYYMWHSNGKLFKTGYFKNDIADSIWNTYDSNGVFINAFIYENGIKKTYGIKPIVTPCACSEPQSDKKYFAQSLSSLMERRAQFKTWEFPFHKSVDKYIDKIFFTHLQADADRDGSFYSMTLECFQSLEIEFPGVYGMKLLLNPCYQKGDLTKMEMYANITQENPNETRLTIVPKRLAFAFDPKFLSMQGYDTIGARGYFKVSELKYSIEGIELENIDSVCFSKAQIGKTDVYLTLNEFIPTFEIPDYMYLSYLKEVFKIEKDEYKKRYDNIMYKPTIGLKEGNGILQFKIDQHQITSKITYTIVSGNILMTTAMIENISFENNAAWIKDDEGNNIQISEKIIQTLFAEKGFNTGKVVLDPIAKSMMVPLIYQTK